MPLKKLLLRFLGCETFQKKIKGTISKSKIDYFELTEHSLLQYILSYKHEGQNVRKQSKGSKKFEKGH